jgi:hypothetical protein
MELILRASDAALALKGDSTRQTELSVDQRIRMGVTYLLGLLPVETAARRQ